MAKFRQKRDADQYLDFSDRQAFRMCHRKRKFKSSEAGKRGFKINQRKYECPICGHWHLTKKGE